MRKKKVTARYAHLRRVIVRAKEDAKRQAEGHPLLMMSGIKDQNAYDFEIYENAYEKFLKKERLQPRSPEQATLEAKLQAGAGAEASHARIAAALERIADAMEKRRYE